MLQVAHKEQQQGLVLGAISCGAFRFIPMLGIQERDAWELQHAQWTADCVKQAYIEAFKESLQEGLLEHVKELRFAVKTSNSNDVNFAVFASLSEELTKILLQHNNNAQTAQLKGSTSSVASRTQTFDKKLESIYV